MTDIIVLLVIAAIIGGVIWHLRKCKKRGDTCIGCPYAKQCNGSCTNVRSTDSDA